MIASSTGVRPPSTAGESACIAALVAVICLQEYNPSIFGRCMYQRGSRMLLLT
jgi:hypothetical protein